MKLLIYLIAIGSLFWISCSSFPTHEKWIKDGKEVGDITIYKRDYGYEYNYKNKQGRLERLEKRDDKLGLISGDCCKDYLYDVQGRMIKEIVVNNHGQKIIGSQGFAIHKIAYSINTEGAILIEHSYYNADEMPIAISEGFHRQLIQLNNIKGKTENITFYTTQGTPASATYSEIGNVSEVDFMYVNGIGEVCIGIFKDPQKEIITRKKLSGNITHTSSSTTTSYHY